jgi:hypothetical protein
VTDVIKHFASVINTPAQLTDKSITSLAFSDKAAQLSGKCPIAFIEKYDLKCTLTILFCRALKSLTTSAQQILN